MARRAVDKDGREFLVHKHLREKGWGNKSKYLFHTIVPDEAAPQRCVLVEAEDTKTAAALFWKDYKSSKVFAQHKIACDAICKCKGGEEFRKNHVRGQEIFEVRG
jgi:hypothetical protein